MGTRKMELVFLILGWIFSIGSLWNLYFQGTSRSYFHQDDVVELGVVARWSGWKTALTMNNEHLNLTFWPLLKLEWDQFGINYPYYLLISVALHTIALVLIFLITLEISKSHYLSSLAVFGFVINPGWYETIWWVTGQMFLIATICALGSYKILLSYNKNPNWKKLLLITILALLPGLSWGVGLTWPIWLILVYGLETKPLRINVLGKSLFCGLMILSICYFLLSKSVIFVHFSPALWLTNPLQIGYFIFAGLANNLVGRWIWPLETRLLRIAALVILTISLFRMFYRKVIIDRDVIFGFVVSFGCFLTYAIPRWQFGVGHAMANYYTYFPLPFLIISSLKLTQLRGIRSLAKLLLISVFVIHIPFSWIGFDHWVKNWTIRPQLTRVYFKELSKIAPGECIKNEYIPDYIVPQRIWKTDYIWPILNKDFDPFCTK